MRVNPPVSSSYREAAANVKARRSARYEGAAIRIARRNGQSLAELRASRATTESAFPRFALAIALYAIAILAIYAGTTAAPDMKWPSNPEEMQAASLLVFGMIAKLAGHFTLAR